MSLVHADVDIDDPLFVHSYSQDVLGELALGAMVTAPTSGTWVSANRMQLYPMVIHKPYPLRRWFWLNGATIVAAFTQVAIYDQQFNLVAMSPRVNQAGSANTIQFVDPGIGFTANSPNYNSGNSTNADSFQTGNVRLTRSNLHLINVINDTLGSSAETPTVTGGGTWTQRATTQFNGTAQRVTLFSCVPTQTGDFDLTIDFGSGNTQDVCRWGTSRVTNVDTTTNDGIVQTNTATGTSTTPNTTLSAFGSADNATYVGIGATGSTSHTPITGYDDITDNSGGGIHNSVDVRFDNDTTPDGATLDASVPWGIIAAEIKSTGSTTPIWIPAGRYYLAITCASASSTFFRKNGWTEAPGHYLETGMGIGLSNPATPAGSAATSAALQYYVCGFTRRSTP